MVSTVARYIISQNIWWNWAIFCDKLGDSGLWEATVGNWNEVLLRSQPLRAVRDANIYRSLACVALHVWGSWRKLCTMRASTAHFVICWKHISRFIYFKETSKFIVYFVMFQIVNKSLLLAWRIKNCMFKKFTVELSILASFIYLIVLSVK